MGELYDRIGEGDAVVRGGISSFRAMPAGDAEDGSWARRHGDLLEGEALDPGYRLVVASPVA